MKDVRPFLFENDSLIRVVLREGNPWFALADVAKALSFGPTRTTELASSLDEDEKGYENIVTLGGEQTLLVINESGLYALIFRSRKPKAKTFRKWVTTDVLLQIRKTGVFRPASPPPDVNPPDAASELHYLAIVRECRLTFGEYQAMKMWMQLPLPSVNEKSLPSYIQAMLWQDRKASAKKVSNPTRNAPIYTTTDDDELF